MIVWDRLTAKLAALKVEREGRWATETHSMDERYDETEDGK